MLNNREDDELVSIMIPVYNGIESLPSAIASVIQQTYKNWECVIVNDGSTDGTKVFLDALRDPRFKVIHFLENKGRPHARQAALEAAKGTYLAFLDADDFYHPKKLEKQVDAFRTYPDISLVSCGMASFDVEFNLLSIRGNYRTKPIKYKMGEKYRPTRAPAMIKLDEAKGIKYNLRLKMTQDTDFFTRYLDGKYYLNLEHELYYYSEFNSVTKSKVLKTLYFGLFLRASGFKERPFWTIYGIIRNVIKILILILAYPFLSDKNLLMNRGKQVNPSQAEEFKRVRQLLLKQMQYSI